MEREARTGGLEGGAGPVGTGQAGGVARRARRRMAAMRLARPSAVGARSRHARGSGTAWAWAGEAAAGPGRSAAGAKARCGGRPGRPERLGRKRGGDLVKERNHFSNSNFKEFSNISFQIPF